MSKESEKEIVIKTCKNAHTQIHRALNDIESEHYFSGKMRLVEAINSLATALSNISHT